MNISKIIPVLACSLMFFSGCGDNSTQRVISEEDKQASAALSEEGSQDLSVALNQIMSNGASISYDNMQIEDWQAANSSYRQALSLDPDNSDAKFGVAVTEFVTVVKSESIETMYNDLAGAENPFNLGGATDGVMFKQAVAQKLVSASTGDNFPEIHQIQDTLAAVVLPALDEAIKLLEDVFDDASFTQEITIENETRKIGHSEVAVLLAGYKVLRSAFVFVVAWDLDIDQNGSYAWIDGAFDESEVPEGKLFNQGQTEALQFVVDLMSVQSPFLTIRSGWESKYKSIDEEILSAASLLKNALQTIPADPTYLMNTTEIDPEEISEATAALDSAIKYLQEPLVVNIPGTDESIKIQLKNLTQITNPKKLGFARSFYPVDQWSAEYPVFYFTNASGSATGDVNDLMKITSSEDLTMAEKVKQLDAMLYMPDPTYSGVFPNMTEARIWEIALKVINSEQESEINTEDLLN
jgi:tetratricopeptide (TPR) repeat protein